MKRIKIVHVCLSGNWSGSEVVTAELANGMCDRHDIGIVFASSDNLPKKHYKDRLHENVRIAFVSGRPSEKSVEKAVLSLFQEEPDIIHGHLGPACRAISKICPRSNKIGHLHIRYFNAQHNNLDGLIAIAPWQLEDVPNFYNGKVWLVRNFNQDWQPAENRVESNALRNMLSLDRGQTLIGSVGRLHSDKGIDILIEAVHQLNDPNAHLLLFGTGPDEASLRKLARGLNNIHFMGFRYDVSRLVHGLDLYISASRSESFGLATLEAMNAGVSVVASETYGSRWLLEHLPERLFPTEDINATVKTIRDFTIGSQSIPDYNLERFNRKNSLKMMENAYLEAMTGD